MHRSVAALTAILLASLAPGAARGQTASILLTKTVGVSSGPSCATGDMLTVVRGTLVDYCYTAGNTGNATFMTHTVVDSEFGNIINGVVFSIPPGQTGFVISSFRPCSSVTNVATWTAQILGSVVTRTSTDSAMVTVEDPVPSLLLTKTVSKAGGCPGVKQDVVLAGTEVTYCYEVGNNGNIALTVHTLVDSELGAIVVAPFVLDPGEATFFPPQMIVIDQDTTNDATATSSFTITCEDQMTTGMATAEDSAEVVVANPTPALDNAGLVVAALMLLTIGGLSLSLRRRRQ